MLIIQTTTLTWFKSERGGKPAEVRNKFKWTFPIGRIPDKSDECVLDERRLYQQNGKILTISEFNKAMGFPPPRVKSEPPVKIADLHVKNVEFTVIDSVAIRVDFSFDPQNHNGAPHRHGHNKDFNNPDSPLCGKDVLNETAFTLSEGQMGQIAYNARFSDWDNGEWWYEQTVINVANARSPGDTPFRKNIFLSGGFDYIYKQLENLR
ncbi:MAG: hypothetical protein HDT42_07055 [Ruminococcaceae bacterium]|nr:hypothetical protein [Oscillospiraceae bacterium]